MPLSRSQSEFDCGSRGKATEDFAAIERVTFAVFGKPAPQGSHKAFIVRGRPIVTDDSARTRPWRNTVAWAVRDQIGEFWTPWDGPIGVRFVFTLPKPLSAPKYRRTFADRRPDWDKLARSTSDALTDAGLYVDDARVIEAHVLKCFPGEHPEALSRPGAQLTVWSIGHSK